MPLAGLEGMAAAIVHELNQPLAAILSNAQALRRMLMERGLADRDVADVMNDIEGQVGRAAAIIEGSRRMMKLSSTEGEPLDLAEIVVEAAGLLKEEAAAQAVFVELNLTKRLPAVSGDRIQLQQVVVNLLQNAIEATGARSGPYRAHVTVRSWHIDGEVCVSVRDRGRGIDPAIESRLFEPFATTRLHGLGLGLAISRAIVLGHRGRLTAANHPDGGAEFLVILPAEA